jgi:sulfate adenylyltransferase
MTKDYIGEIAPHGGVLIDRMVRGAARDAAIERASRAKKIILGAANLSDLELLATGALSPLTGFIGKRDYDSVVESMRLANGLVWSIPITLAVTREIADTLNIGEEIALIELDGHLLAVMTVAEKFEYDKTREAQNVYRTTDEKHPGVARVYKQGEIYLAGEVSVIDLPNNL